MNGIEKVELVSLMIGDSFLILADQKLAKVK